MSDPKRIIHCQHIEERPETYIELGLPLGDDTILEMCEICATIHRAYVIEDILQRAIKSGIRSASWGSNLRQEKFIDGIH